MIIGGFIGGLLSLLVGVVVGGFTIYIGIPIGASRAKPSLEAAFVTAGVGAVLSVVVSVLFGWIPVIGVLLPPAAWIGVVGHRTAANPPTAVGVGLVAWAITLVMTAGISTLALGGVQ